MTTQEKVIKMKKAIEKVAIKYGLNLTIYDGKIGFVDQEQKKIVALWTPEYTLPKESEVAERREDIENSPVDCSTPSVTDSKGERNEQTWNSRI